MKGKSGKVDRSLGRSWRALFARTFNFILYEYGAEKSNTIKEKFEKLLVRSEALQELRFRNVFLAAWWRWIGGKQRTSEGGS